MYLDRSDLEFRNTVLSGAYVDKSAMISHLNAKITLSSKFFLISRPRRFGKTYAAKMLNSYYSKQQDQYKIIDNKDLDYSFTALKNNGFISNYQQDIFGNEFATLKGFNVTFKGTYSK